PPTRGVTSPPSSARSKTGCSPPCRPTRSCCRATATTRRSAPSVRTCRSGSTVGGDALEVIQARRSIGRLTEPAPSDDELRRILEAAAAAPDHGELRPWRFIILRGDAKDAFGEVLADAYLARVRAIGASPTDGQLKKERTKLGRAPIVVVVCAVK